MCSLLTMSGTCDEAHIKENVVKISPSVVTSILPSEDEALKEGDDNGDDESIEVGPYHCFFRIELANGELYALDLCTAQFASIPGEEPWACVVPLDEHLQRLPISEDMSDGWQGATMHLGFQRRISEATPTESSHEEVVAGIIGHDDLCCKTQKFVAVRLEAAFLQWALVQRTDLSKALHLPRAKFMHAFCTIVWPIELMEREMRSNIGLMIVNSLRKVAWEASEPDDYE